MKRNIVQITTKKSDYITPYWDSMWYILNVYENWNTINIKRVPDPKEYRLMKI